MSNSKRTILFSVIAFAALIVAALAQDAEFAFHAWAVTFMAAVTAIIFMRRTQYATDGSEILAPVETGGYMDDVIRYGVIATLFWGIAGFLAGVAIAAQLAWPELNIEPWFNFGRLRPLHTSAVIFAFGGNALLATSFHVVQRTTGARLFGGNLAWFVFWGYQLFIVLAATGYLLGITQSKEYAEPEWYVDLWLTIVWVSYLIVFVGTIARRKEPHIYVANWFFLAFIVTVAMLHVVNNLSIPVSFLGAKSYPLFAGVQGALTQWWYGHNAVGFFLTAGFLGMMYYYIPKRANRPVYSYRLSIIHFWSLIFLYIWAGPHHLHYTALPDWAQTLGMTFSIMLWMPSWGGMINGIMTLSGAWDKLRTDPVLRMMVMAVAFYGMATFEGPMLSIKAVNSPVALYRLDHRSRPFRRAGLERAHHVRRDVLSRAGHVAPPGHVFAAVDQLALLAGDDRYRSLRRLHVGVGHHTRPDVARIRCRRVPDLLLRGIGGRPVPLLRHPAGRWRAVPRRCAGDGLQRLAHHSR